MPSPGPTMARVLLQAVLGRSMGTIWHMWCKSGRQQAGRISSHSTSTFLWGKGGFVSMQWLPDNTRMIFVNLDKTVETWNVSSQRAVSRLHFQERNDEAQMVVLSPDGRYAASVMADQTVEVWNTASGNRICTYRGHQDQVNVVAWSPDAKHIT